MIDAIRERLAEIKAQAPTRDGIYACGCRWIESLSFGETLSQCPQHTAETHRHCERIMYELKAFSLGGRSERPELPPVIDGVTQIVDWGNAAMDIGYEWGKRDSK